VDKPAGVVVHPARGHPSGTLAQALKGRGAGGEDPQRAGIVHRLDRDTSGLLVVAREDSVHRALKSLLSSRRLHREYLALVEGHPASRTGTIDAPIGRDRRDRLRVSLDTDVPRAARTHFELERQLPSCALLRVMLDTGRTHQIRVHLAAIEHPVCGDPLYGAAGRLGLSRQFLHAARLTFPHPMRSGQIDVSSALPGDLEAALQRAEQEVH
jgi:23S rRNA pseudouridine1911/1915/1917 synthase